MACPHCESEDAVYLGPLGKYTWLRCRDCGLDRYIETPECFEVTEEALEDQKDYLSNLYK